MKKYYVTSDCIDSNYKLLLMANNPMEAAMKLLKKTIDKYQVIVEPSNVYVDERGFKYDRMNATIVYDTSEVLSKMMKF